jgi:nitroreductase
VSAHLNTKLDFILGRRSIRVYRSQPVSDVLVRKLLEAAMAAPSAMAKDPWRFVVVRQPETLARLAAALPHGGMIASAPVGIVVCGDLKAAHDSQLSYLLQDCSAAIENLLLAAHALGLGACWLGIHPREDRIRPIRQIVFLPAHVLPVCAVAVGFPGEEKPARTRFNPDYVHHEQW